MLDVVFVFRLHRFYRRLMSMKRHRVVRAYLPDLVDPFHVEEGRAVSLDGR